MSVAPRHGVSVLLLTYNEEVNLEDCLDSVAGWVSDIWIIDSGSTDRTLEIARRYTQNIYHLPFRDFGTSRNWGLEHFDFGGDWVLVLDADERVSPELRDEIIETVKEGGRGFDGFLLNRRYIFYGKWIKHSGWYPAWNLRLFRHAKGRYEKRANHNHVILDGKEGRLRHDLIHEDRHDMLYFAAKQVKFSRDEASEYRRMLESDDVGDIPPRFFGGPIQRKRWLKRMFVKLPARPFFKFLYLYVWKRGFLDGRMGLRFCLMWATFEHITSLHLWEQTRYKEGAAAGSFSAPSYYRPTGVPPEPGPARGLHDPDSAQAEGGRRLS